MKHNNMSLLKIDKGSGSSLWAGLTPGFVNLGC